MSIYSLANVNGDPCLNALLEFPLRALVALKERSHEDIEIAKMYNRHSDLFYLRPLYWALYNILLSYIPMDNNISLFRFTKAENISLFSFTMEYSTSQDSKNTP